MLAQGTEQRAMANNYLVIFALLLFMYIMYNVIF